MTFVCASQAKRLNGIVMTFSQNACTMRLRIPLFFWQNKTKGE